MASKIRALALMAGTLGVYPGGAAAQQPPAPPVQITPVPPVITPPAPQPNPPIQAPTAPTPPAPPAPVDAPVSPTPPPPVTAPQQNGQAPVPPGPAPEGQPQTGQPAGVAVPEVKIVLPGAVKPRAATNAQGAEKPRAAVRTAAPAPGPQPKQQAQPDATPAPTPAAAPEPGTLVKLSPVGGSEVPIEKVAGAVSTVSAAQIAQSGSSSLQDVLQTRVPGVIVNDLQGNGFQTDVQYRGFSASPVDGVAQGLAIYQNGVRINESFGDTVNWDFLPSAAISDIAVMSNNPAFGLNAIGGAISIGMKNGFNYHGGEIDARLGSFGRRQGSIQAGMQSGAFGVYAAYEDISDDGWRDFSPSKIRRFYGDIGIKNGEDEFHFNLTRANNFVGATSAAPVELTAQQGWNRTYTSPQTTLNDVVMPTINGTLAVNDALKLSGVAYYRSYTQRHVDGNLTNAQDCGGILGDSLCNPVLDQNGNTIASTAPNGLAVLAEIDRSKIESQSYGGSVQAVDKTKLWGHGNQFLIGASIDHGVTAYTTSAEFGTVDPGTLFITGLGQFASAPFDFAPRNVRATNDYYGLFVSNVFDVSDALAVTVGGRYNIAKIELQDLTGAPEAANLNGKHTYSRFNPMIGGTYKLMPGLSVYGGYSEANRAPTPVELACSDPAHPCVITSFLTSDPELKQVVAHTTEAGLRGEVTSLGQGQKLEWSLGLFRTLSVDDIIPVASVAQGRGFFQNAGDTLRQGIEASASYRNNRVMVYGSYNYIDATYESELLVSSPNNPQNPNPGNPFFINVHPGNHIPGIPQHKFKAGLDYWMTPEWKIGGDVLVSSSQFFHGDDANTNTPIAGYATVNLHTSYDVTKSFQVYGLINNVFDARYGTYGTYFDTGNANNIGNQVTFTDPRSVTPSSPFAAYGGVKLKF